MSSARRLSSVLPCRTGERVERGSHAIERWLLTGRRGAPAFYRIRIDSGRRGKPHLNGSGRPFLASPNNSLIYLGSNAVYSLSDSFLAKYRQLHSLDKLEAMGREIFVPLSAPVTPSPAMISFQIGDTFVTIGDTAATARIASFLSQRNKAYDMRFGGDISVGDLRESDRRSLWAGSIIHGLWK